MKCQVCGRKAESRFCKLHEEAYKNLIEGYESWRKSMSISWTEYLEEILKNPFTGVWVKEVIQKILTSNRTLNREKIDHS
ncbi:MAG: hypothetical protein RMJ07_05045 [Nitrososphaerota archaeon]|nr:hypothetical protein [Candidatus Bathyarchaeota archaeon]MDW8049032.1 hypothetical protein [Nitrososphaerota archaeon]